MGELIKAFECYSERLDGMLDCHFGQPPKENASQEYLDAYGKQYAREQMEDHKSGS